MRSPAQHEPEGSSEQQCKQTAENLIKGRCPAYDTTGDVMAGSRCHHGMHSIDAGCTELPIDTHL